MNSNAVFTGVMLFVLGASGCVSGSREPSKPNAPYFTGDGGKALHLAVLEPKGIGLSPEEQWLAPLVQGSLAGDFNKYSAMTIADRQNLEAVLAEQRESLSGCYSDADFISIGNMTQARYILAGSITKTGEGRFVLELAVTDIETGERRASYPPAGCTFQELAGMTAVKRAAEDLLDQLGVLLTSAGREALRSITVQQAEGSIALSKGVAAQRRGTLTEALSYYQSAAAFGVSPAEAESRFAGLSADVRKGDIGRSIRTDLERRNAWLRLMRECEDFFTAHPPYTLVYDPVLTKGRIDYEQDSADLSCAVVSYPAEGFKVLKTISDGLTGTGKRGEWNLDNWPLSSPVFADDFEDGRFGKTMLVDAVLLDDAGAVIGEKSIRLVNRVNRNLTSQPAGATAVFEGVKISAITPGMRVSIRGVNGVSGDAGYITITPGSIDKTQWELRREILRNRQ